MFRRFLILVSLVIVFSSTAVSRLEDSTAPAFTLEREPLVRIGLIQNAAAVSITTSESSLIAEIDGEPVRFLNSDSVRAGINNYRVPEYELFRFEVPGIASREEADALAEKIRVAAETKTSVVADPTATTFIVKLEAERDSRVDADKFIADLFAKGIENVSAKTEIYASPSDEAIRLSRQIIENPSSKVRSLFKMPDAVGDAASKPNTSNSSRPAWYKNRGVALNASLREVAVSGGSQGSISSLKPIMIGTSSANGIIRLNGTRYRGKMEIFVNSSGMLTVVNVVPMEDYLLGVVPSELSLPQLEAQKAQAVAARTYAVANKNSYKDDGFDMLPTVWSQVYRGVGIETKMGTQAVQDTAGIVATYHHKPINALYTSTCGGRTENSGNIYEFDEPYLRGVECSLEGNHQFDPFLVKTQREQAVIHNEAFYPIVHLAAKMSVNNFLFVTNRFDDEYFEAPPTEIELKSWLNQVASKFQKPFPTISTDSAKPLNLARTLFSIIYEPTAESNANTLMSESDINYQLSFSDSGDVPKQDRVMLAMLMRDGWFSIHSDLTIKINKNYSRSKIINLIKNIYEKKKWTFDLDEGTTNPSGDGKINLKSGRGEIQASVSPTAYLFRKFGDSFYQVKEAAIIGGEKIRYKKGPTGDLVYLEIEPSSETTVAEKMSPFTNWRTSLSPTAVRSRLSRFVKGMGVLYDVRVVKQGVSRRATKLEIVTSTGTQTLEGGKIRSGLGLKEQLFVIEKRYDSNGKALAYNFVGRGWGHGIGMCQYGAYGFAKMGQKFDSILKHYYTGIELTKAY